jgi:cytochrome c biogenesis protein CcdA
MLDLLLEGLESAWLPCSLILLVPGAAALLAGGERAVAAAAGFAATSIVFSWLRFAERGGDWPVGWSALALMTAAVLLLLPAIKNSDARTEQLQAVAGGSLVGLASAELWEPCVGAEFGLLLNDLPSRGVDGLVLLLAYVAGVLAPLVGLGALLRVLPTRFIEPARPALAAVGGVVLTVMAVATAAGFHDEIVDRLTRWSL